MRSRRLRALLFVSTIIAAPLEARAAIINFESLSTVGTPISSFYGTFLQQPGPVSLDGFTFTSTASGYGLSVWEAGGDSHPAGGAAATSLFEYTAGDTTTITRTGGGAFALSGIDLTQWGADMPGGPGTFAVTFIGMKADLSIVTETFMVARNVGPPVLQSFLFSDFSDVTSVSMKQGISTFGTAFQFNNVVVDGGPTPVPEPGTLLLVASGLVTGIVRRRRSSGSSR